MDLTAYKALLNEKDAQIMVATQITKGAQQRRKLEELKRILGFVSVHDPKWADDYKVRIQRTRGGFD